MDRDFWHDAKARFWTFGLRGERLKNGLRLLALAGLGILLLVLAPLFSRSGSYVGGRPVQPSDEGQAAGARSGSSLASLEADLERESEAILSQVLGAGRVAVSVRLKTGPEITYSDNRTTSRRMTEEKDTAGGTRTISEENESVQAVMARRPQASEEGPVVARIEQAQVDGVVVVAEGASDSGVRAELFRAVQVMLGVPAHKVTVLPMKAGE